MLGQDPSSTTAKLKVFVEEKVGMKIFTVNSILNRVYRVASPVEALEGLEGLLIAGSAGILCSPKPGRCKFSQSTPE